MANKSVRATFLENRVGETHFFLGRIGRTSEKKEGENPTLVTSLYIKNNEDWQFLDHTWIELPEEIAACENFVLLFEGSVYEYRYMGGKKGYGIHFKAMENCEYWDEPYYHGLRMYTVESDAKKKQKRQKVNKNLAIIAAYENGVDLDPKHSFKGKKKEMEKRKIQVEEVCKKEYFADKEYQLNPINIQPSYKRTIKTMFRKLFSCFPKLRERFSKLHISLLQLATSLAQF